MHLLSNVSPISEKNWPLKKALHTNGRLINYLLLNLNFEEIILKKMKALDFKERKSFASLFSKKEKKIIARMFDLEKIYEQKDTNNMEIYQEMYNQEEKDINKTIASLNKLLIKRKNDD